MMKKIWIFVTLAVLGCGSNNDNNADVPRCGEGVRCAPDVGELPDTSTPNGPDSGSPDVGPGADADDTPDASDTPDTDVPDDSCNRQLRADGARKVAVGFPFDDPQNEYELLDLSADGALSRPNVRFAMGRGADGVIQFTPDGEVGFARQHDGTIGVFRINQAGLPEVLAALHNPGFYVSGVLVDPRGDFLYAWETGFRKQDDGSANGALYRMKISCASGMLEASEEVLRGKLIRGASWRSDTQLAVAAVDLLDDQSAQHVHLVDVGGPTRVASARVFTHDDSVVAGFAVTRDNQFVLVGDNSAFSGQPQGIGVARVQGDQLVQQTFVEVADPVSILVSPYNNAALVADGFGDRLVVLDYDPNAASPFSVRGNFDVAQRSLLPGVAVSITRGALDGLGLISENVSLRTIRFEPDGEVTDLGLFDLGGTIPGALGVQP